jgi:hypothetical protein
LTAEQGECPDNLVSSFSDGLNPTWHCLAIGSQTTLRKRLPKRDGGQCIFTGDDKKVEAAHLVKQMHPFWVRLPHSILDTGTNLEQNLVHITCTRAHLSQLPTSLLQKVTGLFDPSVAASICQGLHGYYDGAGSIAFRVVSHISHSIETAHAHNLLGQFEQTQDLSSITLEACPLNEHGIKLRNVYRYMQGQFRSAAAPSGQLYSVPITTDIETRERLRAGPAGPGRPEQALVDQIEVNARPFDIYVEFGLGARIMGLYGTTPAKDISRNSPLTSNYATYVQGKATQREADRIARARADMAIQHLCRPD